MNKEEIQSLQKELSKTKAELEQVRKEYRQETSEDRATSDWHGQPKDEQAKEINRLEKEVYRLKAQLATKPKELTREEIENKVFELVHSGYVRHFNGVDVRDEREIASRIADALSAGSERDTQKKEE